MEATIKQDSPGHTIGVGNLFLPGEKTHPEQLFICTVKFTIDKKYCHGRTNQFLILTRFALAKDINEINLKGLPDQELLAVVPYTTFTQVVDTIPKNTTNYQETPTIFSCVTGLTFLDRFAGNKLYCLTFKQQPKSTENLTNNFQAVWVRSPNSEIILLLKKLFKNSLGPL